MVTGIQKPFKIRGIYEAHLEDDREFQEVRAFPSAEECKEWYEKTKIQTNPRYPQCQQIYSTLCDWEQVNEFLLTKIAENRIKYPVRPVPSVPASNVFREAAPIRDWLNDLLNLPFHKETNEESTLNTLRYLFFHMRCGIYVMIRNNQLVMFVPFVNKDYRNTWGHLMDVEEAGGLDAYVEAKFETLRVKEDYLKDVSRWWANGNIICNVESSYFWGDSYLPQLRHMLMTLCAQRQVPDVEFFINKRDFPQLKRNLTEPYDFIYQEDDHPLTREKYKSYAPICSFFVGKEFADLPLVCTDDWETATGLVFPPHAVDIRSQKNRKANTIAWEDRIPTAFFRGNSTGAGVEAADNQRIHLSKLSYEWNTTQASTYGKGNSVDGVPYLDAGLVQYNIRDRKIQGKPMTYVKPDMLGIPKVERVPMYMQMKYKFHIYVEGHCAAMRYASMMPLGAVILKIDSLTKADLMWYFPLLQPYDWKSPNPNPKGDHIPIKADLSDLAEAITWLKQNDDKCRLIAQNSANLYEKLIALDGQLDFLQLLVTEIASRFMSTADEPSLVSISSDAPTATPETSPDASVPGASALAPLFCTPPFQTSDWFGADNAEYVSVSIGPSEMPVPNEPDHATTSCQCPRCVATLEADREKQRKEEEQRRSQQQESMSSMERARQLQLERSLAMMQKQKEEAQKQKEKQEQLRLAAQRFLKQQGTSGAGVPGVIRVGTAGAQTGSARPMGAVGPRPGGFAGPRSTNIPGRPLPPAVARSPAAAGARGPRPGQPRPNMPPNRGNK